jgi:glyoxylase-like metal-dependent hydrolase (beta-lactamase superfamily II)
MVDERDGNRADQAIDQVAAGVYRLADEMVNVYLVEEGTQITVIDSGLPGLYPRFVGALAQIGRRMADISAVLITHGHPDHIGLAERIRVEADATVWVHEADAPLIDDPTHIRQHWRAERSLVPYILRRPATLRTPFHMARHGGFRPPAVRQRTTFQDGQLLDVPGGPRAIWTPGHTAGSTAFLLPDRGILFTGDALVMRDDITGGTGPRIVARAFTQDSTTALRSLDILARLPADIVLPGHGRSFTGGVGAAADEAMKVGVS